MQAASNAQGTSLPKSRVNGFASTPKSFTTLQKYPANPRKTKRDWRLVGTAQSRTAATLFSSIPRSTPDTQCPSCLIDLCAKKHLPGLMVHPYLSIVYQRSPGMRWTTIGKRGIYEAASPLSCRSPITSYPITCLSLIRLVRLTFSVPYHNTPPRKDG